MMCSPDVSFRVDGVVADRRLALVDVDETFDVVA
jgi:hypothetical protein